MEIVDPRVDPSLLPPGCKPCVLNGPNGDEYRDLPSIITPSRAVITRWTLTEEERLAVARGEDVYLVIFGLPIRPVYLSVGVCDWTDT